METMCISVPEMGKRLGVSRVTAYELANRKGFPKIRVGTRIIIPIAELEKWLEEQANHSGEKGA